MRACASRSIRGRRSIAAVSIGTSCNTGRAARCSIRKCAAGGCAAKEPRLLPLPHVDEVPGDGGGGGHGRRDEMGAALVALAAFEIAVRGRGAALARIELVGIHGEAHRAARL